MVAAFPARFQPWLTYRQDRTYTIDADVESATVIEGKFLYLDHSILNHFGHFIADSLSRIWAWDFLKGLPGFESLKLVVGENIQPFGEALLAGFGVRGSDVVKISEPTVFEDLYVSTPGFSVQNYTSPAAHSVWRRIRTSMAVPGAYPSRIYVSRAGAELRRLLNESAVERLFEAHGFTIVHPEAIPVAEQVNLFSHAQLIAGPGGSNLYNLAFQGRLRSLFLLVSNVFVQNPELMFCAFHDVTVWCFIGTADASHPDYAAHRPRVPWTVDEARLAQAVRDWLASVGS